MLKKFLRKDLTKRIGINIIISFFMLIATIFLSASLNNILSVVKGTDYFFEVSKMPDLLLITSNDSEMADIAKLLKNSEDVKSFATTSLYELREDNITINPDSEDKAFDANGLSIHYSDISKEYMLVFDENNEPITLNEGEIALTVSTMTNNKLETGDRILIDFGGYKKEFTIKYAVKDCAFGSAMTGMLRFTLSDADMKAIAENADEQAGYVVYPIASDDADAVSDLIINEGFTSIATLISQSMYRLIYAMDMVMAACLLLVGICFILIAFLVLRFIITFTMEENYSELGTMQAIGIPVPAIRRLYISKYAILVIVSSLLGLAASFPIGNFLLHTMSKQMVLSGDTTYIGANFIGAIFVILVVLLFSYKCTGKIKKMSVIDTIRGGSSGERYHRRKGLTLNRKKTMRIPLFLALNDVTSNIKRYIVLLLSFTICFILITIPLNTLTTMESKVMVEKFSLDPSSDIYALGVKNKSYNNALTSEINELSDSLLADLKKTGFDNARVVTSSLYSFNYHKEGEPVVNIVTRQILDEDNFGTYSKGVAPVLENEIAMSTSVMEKIGLDIGDSIFTTIDGEEREFIITGTYSDYLQMGESVRINSKIDLSNVRVTALWTLMVDLGKDMDMTTDELLDYMKTELSAYEWTTAIDILDVNIGSIKSIFRAILLPLTLFLGAIIALVVLMMEQLFIVREKGEIAMMKSVGFTSASIRRWHIYRMVVVVISAMIIAIPLSFLSNKFVLSPIFGIMGASVNIQVDPLQAYLLYPGVLLIIIIMATIIASVRVRKIQIQELNNLE